MSILVITPLCDATQAEPFLQLLEGATAVLGPRGSVEVTSLGSFRREIRGKTEIVCVAVVEAGSARPNAGPAAVARDFESVLRSMVAASDLQGCDVRVYTT